MVIKNCPNCGGEHWGSLKCPFLPEEIAKTPEPWPAAHQERTEPTLCAEINKLHVAFCEALIAAGRDDLSNETELKQIEVAGDEAFSAIEKLLGSGAPARAAEWQPISTAPTDEQTPILCWTPHTMLVAYFDNDEWWILGGRGVIEATHWQPLPLPPGALAGDKGDRAL